MDHAGPAKERHLCVAESYCRAGRGGELRDASGVPEHVGRLQVDEVGDGQQGCVEFGPGQVDAQ